MASLNLGFLDLHCQEVRSPPSRSGPDRTVQAKHRSSPYPSPRAATTRRAASPTSSTSTNSDDTSSDSGSEALGPEWGEGYGTDRDDQGEDEVDDKDEQKLIMKPPGEVNRPARGGYNLQATLSWDKDVYEEVRVSFLRPLSSYIDANGRLRSASEPLCSPG